MLEFLFKKNKCTHSKVSPSFNGSFCPDCGCEIKVLWQFLRCECCSSKRSFHIYRNKAIPDNKFCKNCGSSKYYLESKESLEFFDYEYAIIRKEEVNTVLVMKDRLQIWIEEEGINDRMAPPKLLPIF